MKNTDMIYTKKDIISQLEKMNIPKNKIVLMHSSLRLIGKTEEGAKTAGIIRAGLTIPCHYWNFAEHGGDPAAFAERMKTQYPDLPYLLMRPGERIEL